MMIEGRLLEGVTGEFFIGQLGEHDYNITLGVGGEERRKMYVKLFTPLYFTTKYYIKKYHLGSSLGRLYKSIEEQIIIGFSPPIRC